MKKGFTLIELICVIVLLGLIAMIAIPTINTAINNSKERAYNEQVTLIEDTARKYMSKILPNFQIKQMELKHASASMTCKQPDCFQARTSKIQTMKKEAQKRRKKDKTFTGSVVVTWNGKKYLYEYKQNPSC